MGGTQRGIVNVAVGRLAAQAGFRAPSAQSLCSGYLGLSNSGAAPVTGGHHVGCEDIAKKERRVSALSLASHS